MCLLPVYNLLTVIYPFYLQLKPVQDIDSMSHDVLLQFLYFYPYRIYPPACILSILPKNTSYILVKGIQALEMPV
jgi:hypothetical protein